MNMNGLINMVIRQVTRRLINKGIGKGMDMASGLGRSKDTPMTDADNQQSAEAKAAAKRAQQAAKLGRRLR